MAGNVGRPPKPIALKLVTGHASGKAGEGALAASGKAGDPPDHLTPEARAEWLRIAPMLEKRGLIAEEESAALALYCMAYGRWQQAERKIAQLVGVDAEGKEMDGLIIKAPSGYPIQNPYLAIANKAMEQCYQFLQQFGLSPAARARVANGGQMELFDNGGKEKNYFS